MTTFDRRSRALDWAVSMFGPLALDAEERAMRFLEEAIELGHALGVKPAVASGLVERVYSRDRGDVVKEMGQAQLTLDLLSKAILVDADAAADQEFFRIQKIPRQEWQRRHAAKQAKGLALSSQDRGRPHGA